MPRKVKPSELAVGQGLKAEGLLFRYSSLPPQGAGLVVLSRVNPHWSRGAPKVTKLPVCENVCQTPTSLWSTTIPSRHH